MTGNWVQWQDWHEWIVPLILVTLGWGIGRITESLVIRTLSRVLNGHNWLPADSMTRLLKGNISGLITLGAFELASFNFPIERADVMGHIRSVIFIGCMLIATRFTMNLLLESLRQYASKQSANLPSTSIFENLIRIGVVMVGALVILQTLGVSILPILTALGVGGLAVSLALQDTLANLFAGLHMILARQIKINDTVQLENGMSGVVKDIGWRTTTIKQHNGNLVILPNSKMASSIIVNYTIQHPEFTVTLPVPVALDSPLVQVEAIAVSVATDVAKQLYTQKYPKYKNDDIAPFVRYQSYGEAWINMVINIPFKRLMDAGEVRHELLKALHLRLSAEQVKLPFPQHIVHLNAPQSENVTLTMN